MKQIEAPSISEVLDDLKKTVLSELNCHAIGTIESFDTTNQTAKIMIAYKRVVSGKIYSYPLLVDCPVVVITGGNASLRMPIVSGDQCLVFFNDRDIDNWFDGGQVTTLNSKRMHDLSDGIALVGIRSLRNSLDNYDADAAELLNGNTKISLKDKIIIENASKNLKSLIDGLIDELASTTVTIASGSSAGTYPIDNSAAITALKSGFASLLD